MSMQTMIAKCLENLLNNIKTISRKSFMEITNKDDSISAKFLFINWLNNKENESKIK